MAEDNELSTRRVLKAIEELKTLGAIETGTEQKRNKSGSIINICKYDFYNKTFDVSETETEQKRNNETGEKKPVKKKVFDYSFVEPNLKGSFEEWLKYKRSKHQMYRTQDSLERCYKNLKKYSDGNTEKAMKIVNQSKANNWDGLFGLKGNGSSTVLKSKEMNYDKNNDW